ncbi:hypothetical protein FF125_09490 [Aureibaculum algae]|uniref:Uncharacterized protein n=1 Tax=Aureibaculum algae TaxID=2584122 RepID=A0A5B7TTW4_9FLAO|nr:hypothetical protein [Aureibaculum algae]QCX38653.1 hypothetical protein FF125_09490 [Aureibaculum algae]
MELQQITPERKKGTENFKFDNETLNFKLNDFWIWNQSNLIENRTRGILAEFIVKKALDIKEGVRIEWDCYDLITENGIKIEIKSAAYIQSWKQKKYSTIQFGIAQSVGDPLHVEYDGNIKRWSDFYIFCVLNNKDQETLNPIDLNQWSFYVLKTEVLNDKIPTQKTIGLNSLLRLNPIKCNFNELKSVIK